MSLVDLERRGCVRVITLNDPARRNILSVDLCREFAEALAEVNADEAARALVITGAAPAFCAGAELGDLERAGQGHAGALHAVYRSFMDVARCDLPTIAAVNGAAVGAGLNMALACDMRIASEAARFDCRFLKIGLHPGGGHGWMLLRAIGWAEATRMLLLDRPVVAAEAMRTGLVQDVVSDSALLDHAVALGERAAALPRELITRTKASLRLASGMTHEEAFAHETEEQLRSLGEPPFLALLDRLRAEMAGGRE